MGIKKYCNYQNFSSFLSPTPSSRESSIARKAGSKSTRGCEIKTKSRRVFSLYSPFPFPLLLRGELIPYSSLKQFSSSKLPILLLPYCSAGMNPRNRRIWILESRLGLCATGGDGGGNISFWICPAAIVE